MPIDRDEFEEKTRKQEELKDEVLDYLSEHADQLYSHEELSECFDLAYTPDESAAYHYEDFSRAIDELLEAEEIEEYAVDGITHYGVPRED